MWIPTHDDEIPEPRPAHPRNASLPIHYLHCADRDVRDVPTRRALWRYNAHAPVVVYLIALRSHPTPYAPAGDWVCAPDYEAGTDVRRIGPGAWVAGTFPDVYPTQAHARRALLARYGVRGV